MKGAPAAWMAIPVLVPPSPPACKDTGAQLNIHSHTLP